jgi:SAM-dependent methyltransferase
MIAQRPPGAAPVVKASAEALPFRDGAFDAALAVLTVHHWDDWRRGATEMRRVARRVVVVTWAPASEGFWLTWDYFPEVLAADRSEFPHIDALADALGGATIRTVPVPHDCTDGFGSAYWRRPGAYPAEALAAYVTPGSARRRGRPSTGSRRTLSQGAGRNAMGTCSRSTPPTSASSWL